MKLRMTYDKEADAAYIHIKDKIGKGEITHTIEAKDNITLDFDANNKLLGIEILNAANILKTNKKLTPCTHKNTLNKKTFKKRNNKYEAMACIVCNAKLFTLEQAKAYSKILKQTV